MSNKINMKTVDGLKQFVAFKGYDSTTTYSLNDVVVSIQNNEVKIYQSLSDNNTASLSDNTKWKEVSLGGGGGEIGDVGLAPFGIDETLNLRRYLNGQVISQSQFASFTTKLKAAVALYPSLATTEVNWQSEKSLSKLGQCGKFVIDDTAGTIRLPAIVNAQGLTDLQYLGTIKSESLPKPFGIENGVWVYAPGQGLAYQNAGNDNKTIAYSSSTYQDNAPVQQEAVQYPYYIQVATGVEETLPAIREYEINTPFFFGKSMYSDVAPDNASWLVSNGQYNAKTVYPDYYDWLLAHVGETITSNGGKVVLSTDAITDYDWVVNTADETFRLPLLDGSAIGNGSLYYYVGDTVQDASLINAGAVLGQLANKTNFVEAAAASMPSNRKIDLTLGASGSNYTAPANGWFTCVFTCGSTGGYVNAWVIPSGVGFYRNVAANEAAKFYLPALKGYVLHFEYPSVNTSSVDWWFDFIYAEGDQ